jgi:polysaccharide pyruvyl transferase WcaK-like protein
MPAALLAGSFGRRDPGEEAILAALVRALPGWDAIVTSSDPAETASVHGCDAVALDSGLAVGRAVARADATIIAGGMLEGFGEPGERAATASLGRAYALASTSSALGKPTAMLGVGAGRLASRRRRVLARGLIKKADLFVLRDGPSANLLTEAGAPAPFRVGADPAWALFERYASDVAPDTAAARRNGSNGHRRAPEDVIVVLDHNACDESLAARLAGALERLRADGVGVRLQPWRATHDGADDLRLAGLIAARIPGPVEVLEAPTGLADARSTFQGTRLVVALRRHTLIAAAVGQVPSLALAHEPGLADLARRLGQPSVLAGGSPSQLAAAIRGGLAHPPPSRSAIRGQVASAEEGFKLLRLLLSRGNTDDANDLTGLRLEPGPGA